MTNVLAFPKAQRPVRELPLAPYGRTAKVLNGALWVRTGPLAFEQAARDNARHGYGDWMVWPEGKDPRAYRWPVEELEVWLLDTSPDPITDKRVGSLCAFAHHMLQCGALRVVVATRDSRGRLATYEYTKPKDRGTVAPIQRGGQ